MKHILGGDCETDTFSVCEVIFSLQLPLPSPVPVPFIALSFALCLTTYTHACAHARFALCALCPPVNGHVLPPWCRRFLVRTLCSLLDLHSRQTKLSLPERVIATAMFSSRPRCSQCHGVTAEKAVATGSFVFFRVRCFRMRARCPVRPPSLPWLVPASRILPCKP